MVRFVCALALLAAAPAFAGQAEPIIVQIEHVRAQAGEQASADITVADLPAGRIFSFQFEITFDPSIVQLDEVVTGGTLSEGAIVLTGTVGPDRVRVAAAGTRAIVGSGALVRLLFSARRAGESALDLSSFLFNEGDPATQTIGGRLTVDSAAPRVDTIAVALPDTTVQTGRVVRLPVRISDPGPGVYGITFALAYDAGAIEAITIDTTGTLLASVGALTRFEQGEPGNIRGFVATERPISGSGALFTLVVAAGVQEADSRLAFSHFQFNEGEPAAAFRGGRFAIRTRQRGDVSGDGLVERNDAELVLDYLAGRLPFDALQFDAADVSGNGLVSTYDAALILQAAAGLLVCFPVEAGCSAGKRTRSDFGRLAWGPPRPDGSGRWTTPLGYQPGNAPAYSFEVIVPGAHAAPSFAPLPEGWMSACVTHGDSLRIVLAGPTPFPSGDLLVFPTPAPLFGITVYIDDHRADPVAPLSAPEANAFELSPNYPNPFSRATTMAFRLPSAGHTRLTLFDLLGREVARPLDGWLDAGDHQVHVGRGSLGAGIYMYALEAAGERQTQTLIIQ